MLRVLSRDNWDTVTTETLVCLPNHTSGQQAKGQKACVNLLAKTGGAEANGRLLPEEPLLREQD